MRKIDINKCAKCYSHHSIRALRHKGMCQISEAAVGWESESFIEDVTLELDLEKLEFFFFLCVCFLLEKMKKGVSGRGIYMSKCIEM